jgi:acyl transferase domain-containing protein
LLPEGVSVAAANGPSSVVVSGDPAGLEDVLARVENAKRVPVDYASHSAHVEEIREDILRALEGVASQEAGVPFFSSVDADWVQGSALDAGYWYRNLRRTVEFEDAVRALTLSGHSVFIEVSAHPVLTMGIQETVDEVAADTVVVGTLRRDEGGMRRFLTSAGELFTHGVAVDWARFFGDTPARRDLPTYPFQRQRYWLEDSDSTADAGTDRFRPTRPADLSLPTAAVLAGGLRQHGRRGNGPLLADRRGRQPPRPPRT